MENKISPDLLDPDLINMISLTRIDVNTLNSFSDNLHPSITHTLQFDLINVTSLKKALSDIKSNASGVDNIDLFTLNLVFPFCQSTLLDIVNTSLRTGVVPTLWKESLVKPLAKVPLATELNELRPISITCALSKVLEKIIYKQQTR